MRAAKRGIPIVLISQNPNSLARETVQSLWYWQTDAPLLPHQLTRLAKRPSLALGRLGAISTDGSGDIFVAFSTANRAAVNETQFASVDMFPNYELASIFRAAVDATEEAVVNAMVAAETMIGAEGLRVRALPHDEVRVIFEQPR